MDSNIHTNYSEADAEAFRNIRDLTEEVFEETTRFLVYNQLNSDPESINNTKIYLIRTMNPVISDHFTEEFIDLPENMAVRLANFYCEFINLIRQFELDVEPSEDELNKICKLIINYRMDESKEMFEKVTLKAIEYFKEEENNNFKVDQRWVAGLKTINCLISTFLFPMRDEIILK